MKNRFGVLHLFAGLGGGALGMLRAGLEPVGAVDIDPAACADYELLTGYPATVGDLATMTPDELRAVCTRRPDVVFSSPPCKGHSGCLPAAKAAEDKYQLLNSLSLRGIWLALEAWCEDPSPLFVMENVPRIQSRGRHWLDQLTGLLRGYGYAVAETTHDCGELGGLAQHRRRFLLVARHMEQVPEYLYEPPKRRVRGVGEALGELPVPLPGSDDGGPMHRLPRMSPMNWVRLALIPAGGDWRDLPPEVALAPRAARQNGGYGVNAWDRGGHTVVAEGTVRNTWASVEDPRVEGSEHRHNGKYGVEDWQAPAHTVIGEARTGKAWAGVADPRIDCEPRAGVYGVAAGDEPAGTVVAAARHDNGRFSVEDPRVTCKRREGSMGVKGWGQASAPIIAHARPCNHPSQVADPRLGHEPRRGTKGVRGWAQPSHTVLAAAGTKTDGPFNVADPRVPLIVGPELDLDSKTPCHLIIAAADGTWHRPMTTLELAALQGFPTRLGDEWLVLGGRSHQAWRQRIGNAVPPPAAQAIGEEIVKLLEHVRSGGGLRLGSTDVWVKRAEVRCG